MKAHWITECVPSLAARAALRLQVIRGMMPVAAVVGVLAAFVPAAGAQAAVAASFGEHACATIKDESLPAENRKSDYRRCTGPRVATWDGVPLDTDFYLPATGESELALVAVLTGYVGHKMRADGDYILTAPSTLARSGYPVLTLAPRGMNTSCGPRDPLRSEGGCANADSHLADSRYEARDVQHLAGLLADEGIVDPKRVGVIGESYGGGTALQLAVLRDRVQLPDGSFTPWRSPEGRAMRIAAAAPLTAWSDLAASLVKNGRVRDDVVDDEGTGRGPIGVPLVSFFSAFTAFGVPSMNNGPLSDASLSRWWATMELGEPYGAAARAEQDEFATFHSANGITLGERPAPTLLANGLNDDLFPVQEALRHVNRVARVPGAHVAQVHGEYGHGRTNGDAGGRHREILRDRTREFLARWLQGDDVPALTGVEVLVPSCAADDEPERLHAKSWNALATSVLTVSGPDGARLVTSGGDPLTARAIDPVRIDQSGFGLAGQSRCTPVPSDDALGTAVYRSGRLAASVLVGSPEVTASFTVEGAPAHDAQLAARLWDVDPEAGTQLLVSRTIYRPRESGPQSFQLHGTAYRFAENHVAKLELLTSDAPYARPSNVPFKVSVDDLNLRLPMR